MNYSNITVSLRALCNCYICAPDNDIICLRSTLSWIIWQLRSTYVCGRSNFYWTRIIYYIWRRGDFPGNSFHVGDFNIVSALLTRLESSLLQCRSDYTVRRTLPPVEPAGRQSTSWATRSRHHACAIDDTDAGTQPTSRRSLLFWNVLYHSAKSRVVLDRPSDPTVCKPKLPNVSLAVSNALSSMSEDWHSLY